MSRTLPSATALPSVWNKEMDRFICRCEALGDMDPGDIVRALKRKFHPLLQHFVIEEEAVEKRIAILELQDNDYFKEGMEIAVHRAEAAGFMLPPTDDEISARKDDVGEISEVSVVRTSPSGDKVTRSQTPDFSLARRPLLAPSKVMLRAQRWPSACPTQLLTTLLLTTLTYVLPYTLQSQPLP